MLLTTEERVPGNQWARVERNCEKCRSFSESLGKMEYRIYNIYNYVITPALGGSTACR